MTRRVEVFFPYAWTKEYPPFYLPDVCDEWMHERQLPEPYIWWTQEDKILEALLGPGTDDVE